MLLGISRALVQMDPQTEPALRAAGFLTRDPREVERKSVRPARRSPTLPVLQAVNPHTIPASPKAPATAGVFA